MVRQHLRFFGFAAFAGLALRLLFFFRFPSVTDDSLVYGDIAQNWLRYRIYGLTELGKVVPTCLRLPGYPTFLAAVFSIFGVGHYRAALLLQIPVDMASCFLIADLARRVVSPRAAKAAFLLAALCPFLANYSAAALSETWEILFTVLAFDFAVAGLKELASRAMLPWVGCGLAVAAAILLRPDGGLLLITLALWLSLLLYRSCSAKTTTGSYSERYLLRAGLVVAFLALAPLVPWTVRNLRTLHEFQPLAPRYASEPGEFVPLGFNRWVRTWIVDYVSVEEIYWSVPGQAVDTAKLPSRAFDSAEQREQTQRLLADYNQTLHMTPALDARFEILAEERIHAAPVRYYLRLPLMRIADMWLRPRTELLPSDTRWWEFNDEPRWSALAVVLGVLGVCYLGAALAGLVRVRRNRPVGLLISFVVLRSAFLGSLENPEPRYVLECYPVIIVLAAVMFGNQERSS